MDKQQINTLGRSWGERDNQKNASDDISLSDILVMLWCRKYLFLLTFVVLAGLGSLYVYSLPTKVQLQMRVIFPYYVNSAGLHTSLFDTAESKSIINFQLLKLNEMANVQNLKINFKDVEFLQGFLLDTASKQLQPLVDGKINFSWQINQRDLVQAKQMLAKLKLQLQAVFANKTESLQRELNMQLALLRRIVTAQEDRITAVNKQQADQLSHRTPDSFLITMKSLDELMVVRGKMLAIEQLLAGLQTGGFSPILQLPIAEHKTMKFFAVNLLALFVSLILITLIELAKSIIGTVNKVPFIKNAAVS